MLCPYEGLYLTQARTAIGLYLGIDQENLRFYTPEGELIPTPEEVAQQEKQRSDRLATKLRELNIDPDTI